MLKYRIFLNDQYLILNNSFHKVTVIFDKNCISYKKYYVLTLNNVFMLLTQYITTI